MDEDKRIEVNETHTFTGRCLVKKGEFGWACGWITSAYKYPEFARQALQFHLDEAHPDTTPDNALAAAS